MFKIALTLHVLFAVFAIGPLVHAATTAGRAVRHGDAPAITGLVRMLRIYSYASVLVILAGFAVMSSTDPDTHETTAKLSDPWIWLSGLLWVIAVAIVLGVLVPGLEKATELIGRQQPVTALRGRVAAAGGGVGLIFAVVVFLMVFQPGG